MDINHLKSLVAAAKSSDHMYEQQTAAMVFATVYGEQLIAVVEAAIGIKQREDIGGYGHEGIPELLTALAALEGET